MTEIKAFDPSALERIAKIISDNYSGSGITNFFRKADFPEIKHDGTTKKWFVYDVLEKLQKQKDGPYNIAKIIEKLCDPQEYLGSNDKHTNVIKDINEILQFYGLEVDSISGKIIIKPNRKPRLNSQESELKKIFDSRNFHPVIKKNSEHLFIESQYSHAIFECCKDFDKYVREKSEINDDGSALMSKSLSLKGPLKINSQKTESEKNEQEGIMHLCMGLMSAIRNPQAHEPELDWPINQEDALDILSLISFLRRKIDQAVMYKAT